MCARARAVMDEAKDEDEGFEYSSRIALGVHSLARIRARGTGNVCGVRSMCGANGGVCGEGKRETDDCVRVRGDVGRKWRA